MDLHLISHLWDLLGDLSPLVTLMTLFIMADLINDSCLAMLPPTPSVALDVKSVKYWAVDDLASTGKIICHLMAEN